MENIGDDSMSDTFKISELQMTEFLKEKSYLLIPLMEGKRILEVGCGTGNLIQYLPTYEHEIFGSDYSDVYLIKAKEKNLPITFFKADLTKENDWVKYDTYFDTVIASEVIEHIENPIISLKRMYSILKPNGVLILTVPAFNFLYSNHDKKIGHFRRYSINSASQSVIDAGFKIEKSRYWNFLGIFGWLINFKILNKDLETATKYSIINKILSLWLKLESRISFPIGLTVVIKARK